MAPKVLSLDSTCEAHSFHCKSLHAASSPNCLKYIAEIYIFHFGNCHLRLPPIVPASEPSTPDLLNSVPPFALDDAPSPMVPIPSNSGISSLILNSPIVAPNLQQRAARDLLNSSSHNSSLSCLGSPGIFPVVHTP